MLNLSYGQQINMSEHHDGAATCDRQNGTSTNPRLAGVDPWITPPAITQWMDQYGSPLHVYSETALLRLAAGFQHFAAAACAGPATAAYAVKACPAPAVLSLIRQQGFHAEVNSVTEYRQAVAAGFSANQIYVNGVAKSVQFIDLALDNGTRRINVDAIEELELIAARASALSRSANIHLRICPDIVAGGGTALMTGAKQSQFGILETDLSHALDKLRALHPLVTLRGIHVHVGSGGRLDTIYSRLIDVVIDAVSAIEHAGFDTLREVNLGGGFVSDEVDYFRVSGVDTLCREIGRLPERLAIVFEPGRFLVERASALYCRIATLKRKAESTWLFLDAGYCHLTDRAIVGTRYPVHSLRAGDADSMLVRVAGPLCDSADVYQSSTSDVQAGDGADLFRFPQRSQVGDIVEIGHAGAYVYNTGNRFAGFTQPAVLLITSHGNPRLVRRAEQSSDHSATELPA
jgi:diaminopimelate decarboxylase